MVMFLKTTKNCTSGNVHIVTCMNEFIHVTPDFQTYSAILHCNFISASKMKSQLIRANYDKDILKFINELFRYIWHLNKIKLNSK